MPSQDTGNLIIFSKHVLLDIKTKLNIKITHMFSIHIFKVNVHWRKCLIVRVITAPTK